MTLKKIGHPNRHKPDLAHLIRCVQRLEGNPACFGGASASCKRINCDWREYCLNETNKNTFQKQEDRGGLKMAAKGLQPKEKGLKTARRRKISFSIEAPDAKEVILMGDFNDWDVRAHPMKNDGNGIWTRSVVLSPGTYEYKFLIDGQWKEDPGNERTCPNCFGTMNSIVELS